MLSFGFWVLGYSVFLGLWIIKKSPKTKLRKPGEILNSQKDCLRNHKNQRKKKRVKSDEI